MPEACEHLDLVLLELLSGTTAVTLLTAPQIGVDRLTIEQQAGRQAGDDRDQRRPM